MSRAAMREAFSSSPPPYPCTNVVSKPSKLHCGKVLELPETEIEITRLWIPFAVRYWNSFCRSNFAVPTPPLTDQAVFAKRGSVDTSSPAIAVIRTLLGTIWARFRLDRRMYTVTGLPVDVSGSGLGLKLSFAV